MWYRTSAEIYQSPRIQHFNHYQLFTLQPTTKGYGGNGTHYNPTYLLIQEDLKLKHTRFRGGRRRLLIEGGAQVRPGGSLALLQSGDILSRSTSINTSGTPPCVCMTNVGDRRARISVMMYRLSYHSGIPVGQRVARPRTLTSSNRLQEK